MPNSPPSSESGGKGQGRFLAFWTTLPGILTGVAALLTAIVGLVALLNSGSSGDSTPASVPGASSVTTPVKKPGVTGAETSGVLAHGRLALTRGDYADLERGLIEISPTADLIFGPESTPHLFATADAFLVPTHGAGSKRVCTTALSARHDTFEILPQLGARPVCVSTTEGNVAAVTIVSLPGVASAQLVIGYTVWR
jgi:hypothetical protein